MSCPGWTGSEVCSGHGQCLTLLEAARTELTHTPTFDGEFTYTNVWDAEKIQGCACDEGWSAYDCSVRQCPLGDDPLTTGGWEWGGVGRACRAHATRVGRVGAAGTFEIQSVRTTATDVDEVQTVTVTGTDEDEVQTVTVSDTDGGVALGGTFTLTFDTRGLSGATTCNLCGTSSSETTGALSATASAGDVSTALDGLANVDAVTVTSSAYSSGGRSGTVFTVTFSGSGVTGNVPELVAASSLTGAWGGGGGEQARR